MQKCMIHLIIKKLADFHLKFDNPKRIKEYKKLLNVSFLLGICNIKDAFIFKPNRYVYK